MALTPDDVAKLAELARLSIDSNHVESTTQSVSSILHLVDQLKQVDTKDVSALAHPLDITQRLRADEVSELNQRDEFQKIAPEVENGLYLVPRVVE
ncbi:MAG: Asp-tRNA(Asn)/Glu-tRNA(Gln) amidotransferase subunit GatC [Porticoccaceae bacterium]|jgi:aspartyl-tRNA(Asn)/glutamyl-tRNA(Gln) amidotransferase subunit C|nr:Asp-tRNA(Asn)/Glu-tRNA(Gln) amidotransferase subunit GatC [Porticoccaceae bacterium]